MKHKTYYYQPAKLKKLYILLYSFIAISVAFAIMTVVTGVSAYLLVSLALSPFTFKMDKDISFIKKNPCIKFKDGHVITFSRDGQQTIRFEDICETVVSKGAIQLYYVYNGMRVSETIRIHLLSDEDKAELSAIFEPNLIAYRVS